ncbi:MAG: hypothetical protein COZ80_03205 [Ignavibacteria bacterium CG_4_8_14_3_um_filter_37_9]|nr:TlpA family protein disulfide reductase [Ignavibacteria bacterium]OIO15156.1 MAG: hypothetical protein AUJ54_13090 [Ignavibacteria bacterium CG1_02_37_35]PIP76418.1 MAG: hypothetical protein COW85_14290 [Ignavibacteria bacterium CG22_combo_CG10-13_8_21_14_all_37_15]PIW99864.1 MAG: hypothetical protein COZ80_03205 [Ignavibacteria bacterium CG_4_8_14_3_um_filter_37_9]PIX93941.1 MAG: hypothetical protein COZ25_08100 [Ignavibacteria bacterium CG_4_10_14_3_um_filter_37_18]PJC59535.1 MAG: hypothe
MKNIAMSFTFFVLLVFMFSSPSLAQSKKAPEFSLKDIEGKTIKLSDYKNKVVLIDFWATWCPPCRKGIPDLIELQKEFPKNFVVLGISVDSDTKEDVPGFVKNYGINYPVVYGDQSTAKLFGGVSGIPTSFLIDKKGNIVDKHVGLVPKETLARGIKNLLIK